MPLYEYQCESCGRRFEVIRKYSDPPLESCPTCGGTVQKLFSSPAIQFKGTGWYVTDYAKKIGTDSSPADTKASSDGGKSEADKTVAKPADTSTSSESKPSATSSESKSSESKSSGTTSSSSTGTASKDS